MPTRRVHNALVGAPGFEDTVSGIRNAVAAGLNVSVNTPLCSLNRDTAPRWSLCAAGRALRHLQRADPAGGAVQKDSIATRLSTEELTAALRSAKTWADHNAMELEFTSPGWLPEGTLQALGFTLIPQLRGPACPTWPLRRTAPCCPARAGCPGPGLGDLHQPWQKIRNGCDCRRIRRVSARMEHLCQLGDPRRPKEDA